MTPSGPQPGDVDTAITHDSDQCWAHVELTNTSQGTRDMTLRDTGASSWIGCWG